MISANYERALRRLLMSESTPKLGLSRIEAILSALGNPHHGFVSYHVAGTNGKGSTSAFLASLLAESGLQVGLYTSPHLSSARERIQIRGKLIAEDLFCEAEEEVFRAAERIGEQPTFFERMTAMAFWAFDQQKVSAAVVEVGLGGKLDATNVVNPTVSVLTRIDLDHCEILGDTIEAIAFEKAGIIKNRVPVVTGWQDQKTMRVIESVAREKEAKLHVSIKPSEHQLGLLGGHQKYNAALATAAIQAAGISITQQEIRTALLETAWPGRFELVSPHPTTILDGAHNPSGMQALVHTLCEKPWCNRPLIFVMGATQGHDIEKMLFALKPISKRIQQFIVTKSRSLRAVEPERIEIVASLIAHCTQKRNVRCALDEARKLALASGAIIVVCGSLFVVGEARSLFLDTSTDPELPLH